jgi:hypothetical protein
MGVLPIQLMARSVSEQFLTIQFDSVDGQRLRCGRTELGAQPG